MVDRVFNVDEQSSSIKNYAEGRKIASNEEAEYKNLLGHFGLDDAATGAVTRQEKLQENNTITNNIMELVPSVGSGILAGVQELGNTAIDLADWVDNNLGSGDFIDDDFQIDFLSDPSNVFQPKTTTGRLVRGVSQFLLPFGAASKAAKGIKVGSKLGKLAKAGAIGAAVDFAAFDPKEERISNLIQENPVLSNPITEYLAADPDDSAVEGRFKNTLEGLGLGALTEGLFMGVRAVKRSREAFKKIKDSVEVSATVKEGVEESSEKTAAEIVPDIPLEEPPPFNSEVFRSDEDFITNVNDTVSVNIQKLNEKDFNNTVNNLAKKFEVQKRGVLSDVEVTDLANETGLSVEELLELKQGSVFPVEKIRAANEITNAAFSDVQRLAKNAGRSKEDLAAFTTGINNFIELRARTKALGSEAARVLREQKPVSSLKQVDEILKIYKEGDTAQLAGVISDFSPQAAKKMADKVGLGKRIREAAYETWINGLLSGPSTHAVNIVSGLSATVGSIGERSIAYGIGTIRGSDNAIKFNEVTQSVIGALNGFSDGLRAASEILRKGPIDTQFTKLNDLPAKAITAEAFQQTGNIGKAIDFLGGVIRLPGRALVAGDEFLKTINYRMETHALAAREANTLGLSGDAFKSKLEDLISNPPERIKIRAEEASRINTFTQELGPTGKNIDHIIKNLKIPGTQIAPLKVVVPFVRTNLNLITHQIERNPLFAIPGIRNLNQKFMTDLAAGGIAKDMAIAKMTFGGSIMAVAAGLASQGIVTGNGPKEFRTRRILEESGWKPNSIRIGDTYFSFDRIDPFGSMIGFAADFAEIAGAANSEDIDQAAFAMSAAISDSFTPEFLTSNMADFLKMFDGRGGPDQQRRVRSFLKKTASSALPFSSFFRSIRKEADPIIRDTKDVSFLGEMLNSLKATVPGWSSALPPQLNMLVKK